MMASGSAMAFAGHRAADPINPPDPAIAAALAGDRRTLESVLGEWELWRRDRLEYDRGAR
jgi:hypothetical protein